MCLSYLCLFEVVLLWSDWWWKFVGVVLRRTWFLIADRFGLGKGFVPKTIGNRGTCTSQVAKTGQIIEERVLNTLCPVSGLEYQVVCQTGT